MQETRQQILEILREKQQSTVEDIVQALRQKRGEITAVTVRHHLSHLQKAGLITEPELRHRNAPGRPQHLYALTEQAQELFPNNYKALAQILLKQIEAHLPESKINVIIEGVATEMAEQADIRDAPLGERVKAAVVYLNEHGYNAAWEACDEGFILRTTNCPYHSIAQETQNLCQMDMRLVSALVGVVPRLLNRIADGESSCAYLIPAETDTR